MKRILLVAFLSFLCVQGFSQAIIGVYGGAGCATSNNYDVAPSGGLEMLLGHNKHMRIGADVFYQAYSLYADNEANSSQHGTGTAGTIDRFTGAYVFVSPKFSYGLGQMKDDKLQKVRLYFDVGIGYNMGGFDSLRKWDHGYYANGYYTTYTAGVGQYDSSLDKSSNINKMIFRVGVGATEYLAIGGRWYLTFTEDFGFLTNNLTTTGTVTDASRTPFSRNGLRPGYVSLQIGLSHFGKKKR